MVIADFNCWEPETNVSELRGNVGAACKMNMNGNAIQGMLFFTTDGLLVVKDLAGDEEGPYAL